MGSSQNAAVSFTSLLLISSLLLTSNLFVSEAQSSPPIADGLSWNFYQSSCPDLESIIQKQLKKVFKKDIEQAAGLLRLHFHDCFVLGCEGSVLLNAPNGGPSTEQNAIPNQSLRQQAFEIIEDLRRRVHNKCGRIVSCADIVALAARDSVLLAGGPNYNIPLGRRDGLTFATDQETLDNLPSPFSNATVILDSLSTRQNLDATDVVALSGGHTIGISHCGAFTGRLYPNQDSSMDKTLANNLKNVCPTLTSNGTVVMDIRTPNKFDNRYYVGLMNRQGLFTSDQDLYTDRRTRGIVTQFAINETLFFEKFVGSMIKMGQLRVLTGRNGQIRARCSATNSNGDYLKSMVEKAVEGFSELI